MDRILSKKAVVVGIFMLLVGVGSLLSASSSIDGVNHVITSEHLQKISHATTTSQTFTGELDDDCCGIIATGTCVKDNRSIFWKTRHSDDSSNKPYYNDDYTYTFYSCGPSDAHYKAGINEVGLALGSFTADSPGFISLANRQFNSSRTASPERCRRWALGHYSTVRDAAVYIAQNIEIEAGSGDNIGIVSAEFGVGAVVSSFNQSGYVYSHITWVNNTWQPIDNYLHCEGLHSDPDGTGDTVQAIWEDITDTGSTKSSDGDNKVTWKDVCHLGGKNVSGQEWGTGTIDTTDEISRSASVNTFVAVSGNNSYNGALNLAWIQMGRQALVGIFLPLAPSYLTSSSDIFHSWTDGNGMEDIMAPKVMYATGGGGFTSDSYDCSKTREILHYANNNENHTFDEYSTLMSSIMTSANENDAEAKMKYFVNENTETPLFYYIKNLTFGPVYNVEKNATYQSLQQAVDAADPGNTIKVLVNTTFNEHVIINKAITLIGKNNTKTIINGSSGTGSYDTIKITANNVTIKNFTIQGAYYAGVLLWTGVRDCRIENNIIANNYDGIELWESNINNTITGNSITNNAYRGVWLRSLDNNNTITGNTINSNSWSGIRAEGSSNNNTITNNVLSNNLCGISLYSINGTLVSYNTITYNTEDGMYLGSSNSNRIINNTISNNAYDGVYVFYDNSNNLITNCTIRYNGRTGIWLDHSNNNIIYNNYFNNTQNAYDNGTNKWNITKTLGINIFGGSYLGGNYWNDYIGGDIDADGLGDTFLPYNSSSKITTGGDYHPLAELDHAPSQPGNPFPPDQTTGVLITADLSWSATDSDLGDSITYDVYFGTAIPPPKVGAGNQTGTYDPGIMNFNTLYYWKIVAWDNHGASTAGPIWNFTTSINNPPNASGSPSPANSSTNVPIIQTLSWTGGDPDGDTVKYDVYFGMNTTPSMAVNNQSELSYGPLTLLYYKTYYWRIVAWDNHGASTNGSLWHFTTKRPTTVYVDDNFNENTPEWNSTRFASIQKGIDQVADGGTVFVWDGTYSELCSATSRSFNLTGNSSSTTFIKGAGSGTLLNLQSSQLVNISGFTIQNGGVGIGLDGCSYIHIINTVVTNNTNYGIYLHTSSYNNISGNNVSANKGQGIYLYDACSFNDLWSNTVQNNTNSGLYLFYASDNILHLNTANNNQVGIQVSNSQNNDLTGNIANNNAQHGIYIRYSGPDNYVIENTVNYNGQNGVYLDHSSNNNIFDNIVNDNTQNGVLLEYDSNSNDMSSSNTVNNNGIYGVYLRYCTGNMITQNTIQENQQYDLYVDGNDDSQFFHSITNNIGSGGRNIVYLMNFFNNYWTGTCSELFLYNADNSRFDYIICSGSDTKQNNGIIIRNTDLATFSHVTSSTNYYGFMCVNCNNNTFFDNTVGNNKFDGIYLSGSDNKVFYNTIITNNNDGISIPGSASILRGNLIHDNIISYNYNNGISLYGESTMQPNRIYSNNITNNSYGIHAFPNSNNNMIYHNNFKGNSPLNAWDDGWNTWDDSISEGNYWDNWGGGGWYSIPGPTGRFDHYPFNTPFAWRPSLNNAVDNAGVVLSTGGTAPWFGQKDYYHVYMNNNDSAQSGHVGDSQYSWLKTTVTGPVTLTFYWKVSSEINHDNLIFSVDGYEQARISGEIDWQQSIYTISSGSHQLQWNYTKDTSIDVGLDCGWIDLLDSTPNNPPNNPTSPSPANASTGISITADLSWTGGDPDTGDTVLYDVYFGTTNPSPKVSSNQSGTTYDTGTMNFNTMYYWKIVAWDNHGASTIGPLWNFTTKINNPPNIPSSPNPANSSTNVQITPILSWTGGDPDGDTVTYDVYFGFISPPSKVISNQSATTYNPGTLSYNTTYFWKIISWDNHSASTVGPIWQFTTQTTASPHWPMFRRMVNHTAYTSDQGPFTNNQLWVYTIGNTVISSPSVIDGVLYVGSADNKVYAFYASNGSKIWEYTTGSYIFSSPAVAEGKVYIGSFDNKIYALNANNGSKIWSYTTGEGVYSSPTIDNQIIYVGSDDNKIYALNAMNGSFIWSYTTGGDVRSSPAVVQNIVYVGADDGKLYAFYANNGTKKWENSIGCDRSSPAVDNGIVYIGSVNSGVYAVYANNGTTKWSYMIGTGGQVRSSPAIANGLLFIGSDNGKLYALNLSNGSKVWEKTLGDNGVRSSPAVAGNNIVYVGDMATTGGKIFALNASTGAEIWIYQTNMQIESSPAIVDNVMYTGGGQKVYAFGLPAKLSPVGQWPFNEGSGTIAYDQTSFHNDGTISGATWTTGYSGYALSFDGSSSKVTVLNSSSIDITEPFIVQTWINLTGAGDYYAIVDKYQYIDGSDSRGFTFYINSGHLRLSMYCGTHGSCDIQSPAGNLRDSKWHYVVGMWDGNYAKIFVDGKQNASAAWIYPPASTNNPLGIGQRLSGHGGTMPFQGKIDEVSISLLNNPPNIPTNPNPPNDATSVNRTTDLSWVGGDPDSGDVVKYDLYFGATNPPSKIISNQTSSTYDPGTMDYITTYYWRIVAWDSHNVSAVGPLWKFTTEVPPGFYLNLNNFPMYPAIGPNYTQMCGPAVAQMTLNYIWWNSSNFTTPPLTFDNQTWLYQRGKENNSNISLPYLDTQGLWHVIQYNKPMPYTTYGYNFNRYSNTNSSIMLKQICEWINYPIGTYGGYKAGYPLHVPAVVPAYGNYSNWMAVRGFNANHSAYPLPSNLTIYGFWVNDPMPNGIGANIYTTVNDWLATYYKPLQTTDQYNGKYVAICEPPETRTDTKLNIAPSPARFTINQKEAIALAQTKTEKTTDDLIQKINKWIIEAATTGATQQLSPYDAEFAAVFSQSVPGTPLFIKNLNGGPDYYAVPFSIPIKPVTEQLSTIRNNAERNTVVVIFINATDGSFKEASWTQEPMIYLPVSQEKATILVQETLNEKGIYLKDPTTLHIDLVYRGSSPYYPEWRITSEELGLEFLVNQEGRLS